MTVNFEIIVGTYEQFLLGYSVDEDNYYKMEQKFATHSHLASIRSISSSKNFLASSAADDTVCLYDMRSRTESGKLVHHNDTVNCIAFTPNGSHLITGSSDGTIGIVRSGNWQLEKHWQKPHKGLAVDAVAVHPSGKIALTTGHDGVLRTWNLVKGRQAYATNLVPRLKMDAKNINILEWSPDGNHYLISANNRVDLYSVETAGIVEELNFDSKITSSKFLTDEIVICGFTDGKIRLHNFINKDSSYSEVQAHDSRVKCLACMEELIVSACSSGEIKLWLFAKDKLNMLSKVNCGARISCMTLSPKPENKESKEITIEVEKESEVKSISNKLRLDQKVTIEHDLDDVVQKKKKKKRSLDNISEETNEENTKNKKAKKLLLASPEKKNKRTLNDDNSIIKKKLKTDSNKKNEKKRTQDSDERPKKNKKNKKSK